MEPTSGPDGTDPQAARVQAYLRLKARADTGDELVADLLTLMDVRLAGGPSALPEPPGAAP